MVAPFLIKKGTHIEAKFLQTSTEIFEFKFVILVINIITSLSDEFLYGNDRSGDRVFGKTRFTDAEDSVLTAEIARILDLIEEELHLFAQIRDGLRSGRIA
jgi:hypothetical protein